MLLMLLLLLLLLLLLFHACIGGPKTRRYFLKEGLQAFHGKASVLLCSTRRITYTQQARCWHALSAHMGEQPAAERSLYQREHVRGPPEYPNPCRDASHSEFWLRSEQNISA
jgi:hypothetical protein